jgi:hypothetical protein
MQRPLRWASRFLLAVHPVCVSAIASADDMKQEVSNIASAYMDCFIRKTNLPRLWHAEQMASASRHSAKIGP